MAVRPEDTKATLFGYLPKKGVAPGAFSGQQMSFSTAFPLPAGPASLKASHLPVVALTATDPGLQDLLAAYPNPATDAYAGLYVLRIRTFAVGEGLATTYLSADIAISGNTWTQVYPVPQGAATATLPAPAVSGTSVAAGPAGALASGAGSAGPAASAAAGPTVGAAGSGSTALPRTGAESGPMLGLGSSLEVAGVLALATARRRRRPRPRHAYGPEPRHARARRPRHQF